MRLTAMALAAASVLASLMGCNGWVSPTFDQDNSKFFTVASGLPLPGAFIGSAVQWNDDYAVTVAHIPLLSNRMYACSTRCDLAFIRHPANAPVPHWRQAKVGEFITALGLSPLFLPVRSGGRVAPMPFVNIDESNGERYAIHDAALVKGMSGGPVIADSDGSVLGINVGFTSHPLQPESLKRLSIFVPYSIIEREWRLFQSRQIALVAGNQHPGE
ncbi:hypothetical protein D9M71_33810 [compost metagenome]